MKKRLFLPYINLSKRNIDVVSSAALYSDWSGLGSAMSQQQQIHVVFAKHSAEVQLE